MPVKKYKKLVCGNCLKTNKLFICESTQAMGFPDLDNRPNGDLREAINYIHVNKCKNCGYCNTDLKAFPAERMTKSIVKSEAYKEQLNNKQFPDMANQFLCKSMLLERNQAQIEDSAWATLYAAWNCDDSNAYEQSKICRKRAIDLFELANKTMELSFEKKGELATLLVDLYRRTEQFDIANEILSIRSIYEDDEQLSKILKFQRHLVSIEDVGVYKIDDAIKYYDDYYIDGIHVDHIFNDENLYDDTHLYDQPNYKRDYFYAMTDGEFGDYDDFIRRGGNIDDIDSWAGR